MRSASPGRELSALKARLHARIGRLIDAASAEIEIALRLDEIEES